MQKGEVSIFFFISKLLALHAFVLFMPRCDQMCFKHQTHLVDIQSQNASFEASHVLHASLAVNARVGKSEPLLSDADCQPVEDDLLCEKVEHFLMGQRDQEEPGTHRTEILYLY